MYEGLPRSKSQIDSTAGAMTGEANRQANRAKVYYGLLREPDVMPLPQEEEEEPRDSNNQGINLTGFLFGNIDRDGHLEENFLDETSKKKLGGLSSMLGLGSLIQDEVKNAATGS